MDVQVRIKRVDDSLVLHNSVAVLVARVVNLCISQSIRRVDDAIHGVRYPKHLTPSCEFLLYTIGNIRRRLLASVSFQRLDVVRAANLVHASICFFG